MRQSPQRTFRRTLTDTNSLGHRGDTPVQAQKQCTNRSAPSLSNLRLQQRLIKLIMIERLSSEQLSFVTKLFLKPQNGYQLDYYRLQFESFASNFRVAVFKF